MTGGKAMEMLACWMHEQLVCDTTPEFARRALPDSVLAGWDDEDGSCPYRLVYEIHDAVPNEFGGRAFHVTVSIELTDLRRTEAELTFTVEDPPVGDAYVHDIGAVREGFDDPSRTLEWNESEGLWETMPGDCA